MENIITLGNLASRSVYGSVGTLRNDSDLNTFLAYVGINKDFLAAFPHLVFSLNGENGLISKVQTRVSLLLPNTNVHIVESENLGHTFGTFLSDASIFNYCANIDCDYVWKFSNDVVIQAHIFEKTITENKDFYYINNIGYPAFQDYSRHSLLEAIYNYSYFYPQTNFYIIKKNIRFMPDISQIYELKKQYDNILTEKPGIQPWHAIQGCDCEHMLKCTVNENSLAKEYLLSKATTEKIINYIYDNHLHDGSHKNIIYSELGNLCHLHFPNSYCYTI